jgi:hypothetical protein
MRKGPGAVVAEPLVTGRLAVGAGRPEAVKRPVTDIKADEVGASLKWAPAEVERTNQRDSIESGVGALGLQS